MEATCQKYGSHNSPLAQTSAQRLDPHFQIPESSLRNGYLCK